MPVEAITCTGCGSGDVQEVKPDTYFCNHCESVFKYLDPTKLTVENAPAFCSCGNKIEVQCNICHKGICNACDFRQPRQFNWLWMYRPDWIPVYGGGYGYYGSFFRAGAGTGTIGVFVARNNSEIPSPSAPVHGARDEPIWLWLPILKVLESFAARSMLPNHVCVKCIEAEVAATAELLKSGRVCLTPDCDQPAVRRCRCCEYWFCEQCLNQAWPKPEVDGVLMAPPLKYSGDAVCPDCRREESKYAKAWLKQVCMTEYSAVLELSPYGIFQVPGTYHDTHGTSYKKGLKLKRQNDLEAARVEVIIGRCATELTNRLAAKGFPFSGSCARKGAPDADRVTGPGEWFIWDDGLADADASGEVS